MKTILFWAALLVLVGPLASCKREMMEFSGIEGVYFAVQTANGALYSETGSPFRPYTNVEMVRQPKELTELQVKIKVMITGPTKDYDRPFRVEINPDSTTAQVGVHYLPLPETVLIPANSVVGYVPITFKRTPDLLTENKKVGLRLLANEHFGLSFPNWKAIPGLGATYIGRDSTFDASLHTINVNDMMVQPAIWRGSIQPVNRDGGSWGAFTRKKIELMFELFDLTYEDFSSEATMTPVLVSVITSEMGRYLLDKFNAGTPVLEDDGRLMFAGSVPWTSYIGVKYEP